MTNTDRTISPLARAVIDALSADLSQPLLKGLGLGGGDRLDDTQQRFGISSIRFASFPVKGAHFQPVTICHHFICTLIGQPPFSRLLVDRPGLMMPILQVMCSRLRETTDQLESIALYPLEARLARGERLTADLDRRIVAGKSVLERLAHAAAGDSASAERLEAPAAQRRSETKASAHDVQAVAAAAQAFAERLRMRVHGLAA
jgi:hypothetical protein